MLSIYSWNINGLRAVPDFLDWLQSLRPDVLCLQEVRADPNQLALEVRHPEGYHTAWATAGQPGYSGIAIYTRHKPLHVHIGMGKSRYDCEGRTLTLEFEQFYLISAYVPSGAPGRSKWYYKMAYLHHLLEYIITLRAEGKAVVLCGDFNIAHTELDLVRPIRVAGFMAEERDWISELLENGFVDSFRALHPERSDAFTWWSYRLREQNRGWRMDYAFISSDLLPFLQEASIHPDIAGSDHCPISLKLQLSLK
ncbi:MAG TPA: exodeoxyribonuclease III [Aggregatilineales bacterium]|nr:exodeoxyribonuclease III [Aggregatilineales bacterium]